MKRPKIRVNCDQCQALMIQGVFCHETGCPNTHKRFIDGEWLNIRECRECGSHVIGDDVCCEVNQ